MLQTGVQNNTVSQQQDLVARISVVNRSYTRTIVAQDTRTTVAQEEGWSGSALTTATVPGGALAAVSASQQQAEQGGQCSLRSGSCLAATGEQRAVLSVEPPCLTACSALKEMSGPTAVANAAPAPAAVGEIPDAVQTVLSILLARIQALGSRVEHLEAKEREREKERESAMAPSTLHTDPAPEVAASASSPSCALAAAAMAAAAAVMLPSPAPEAPASASALSCALAAAAATAAAAAAAAAVVPPSLVPPQFPVTGAGAMGGTVGAASDRPSSTRWLGEDSEPQSPVHTLPHPKPWQFPVANSTPCRKAATSLLLLKSSDSSGLEMEETVALKVTGPMCSTFLLCFTWLCTEPSVDCSKSEYLFRR